MASEQEQLNITLKAEGDLSSYQYYAVNVTNSGYGTIAAGSAAYTVGILQNKPAAYGRAAKVCVAGHTKAIAGAAISTIGYVEVLNHGLVQGVSTQSHNVIGINTTTAAGSGEYVEILLGRWRHG